MSFGKNQFVGTFLLKEVKRIEEGESNFTDNFSQAGVHNLLRINIKLHTVILWNINLFSQRSYKERSIISRFRLIQTHCIRYPTCISPEIKGESNFTEKFSQAGVHNLLRIKIKLHKIPQLKRERIISQKTFHRQKFITYLGLR